MRCVLVKCSRTCTLKAFLVVVVLMVAVQYGVNLSIYKASNYGNKVTYWSMLRNLSGIYETVTTTTVPPLNLSVCPVIPPGLQGRVTVNTQIPAWAFIEEENPLVTAGGRYKPHDCISRNRVAIVIPYRDREIHLKLFLQNLHPFLQRQQLDYGIFVVEMVAGVQFNRALLMNVGFNEAMKQYDYQCFIFHDVDLLPEDDRNLYTCPHMPRHMSTAIDKLKYKLPYAQIFGGVSAISTEHFHLINGFSNIYFGWGGEDDDMYKRILYSNLTVTRYSTHVARYKMLVHKHSNANPERFKLLKTAKLRQESDGISSLKYDLIKLEKKPLYTWVLVSVNMTDILNSEPLHKHNFQASKRNPLRIQNMDRNKNDQLKGSTSALNKQHNNEKENVPAKPPVNQPDLVKGFQLDKKPRYVDWIPEGFKGDLPENLTKFQPAKFVEKPVLKRAVLPIVNNPVVKSHMNSDHRPAIGQNHKKPNAVGVNRILHNQHQQQQYLQQRKQQLQQRQRSMRVHDLKSRIHQVVHKNAEDLYLQQLKSRQNSNEHTLQGLVRSVKTKGRK